MKLSENAYILFKMFLFVFSGRYEADDICLFKIFFQFTSSFSELMDSSPFVQSVPYVFKLDVTN